MNTMKTVKQISSFIIYILVLSSCGRDSITGRTTGVIENNKTEAILQAHTDYQKYLIARKDQLLPPCSKRQQQVLRVGLRLKKTTEEFIRGNNLEEVIHGFEFEFHTVQEERQINAWCMPGGKIMFYTSILPICKDDNGIAAVMAHEIAHALLHHGAKRMTSKQFAQATIDFADELNKNSRNKIDINALEAGIAMGFLLPNSRRHETESDLLGLRLLAMAGYDPREAPKIWERMSEIQGGNTDIAILSTHPTHRTRIKNLSAALPIALQIYKKAISVVGKAPNSLVISPDKDFKDCIQKKSSIAKF